MAVIAFCQHRLGRTDGVSLEVDKWRTVLEGMGHTVHYIAGNEDVPGGNCVPELYPFHPVTERIIKNATVALEDYADPKDLLDEIFRHRDVVKDKMLSLINGLGVDLMVPNNLLSVGYNIPGMIALSEILRETGLPAVCHSHDFWWEDSGEVSPTCDEIVELYMQHAPPDLPGVQHVVINRLAQGELKRRRGIDARVVPNVFDFGQPVWSGDDYNRDFRSAIGLGETDLVFLQATRILDRKAVELAIDVVARLDRPENRDALQNGPLYDGRTFGPSDRIVLVCAGYIEGIGLSADYQPNLARKAEELGVDVHWVGDIVKHSRGAEGSRKIYSLWDSYCASDFVTYPSVWEGWGNQFIEAVFAKLPVVLFEYPVYVSDLGPLGFDVVSLGDSVAGEDSRGLVTVGEERLDSAAKGVVRFLKDAGRRTSAVEHNFQLARENFSLQALSEIISDLLDGAGIDCP